MATKVTNKEVQVRPIKIPIQIGDNPDLFFELNPTLKNAVIDNDKPVFPDLSKGTNIRLAFYAVLLAWFDSPLISEPNLKERKRKAASFARIANIDSTDNDKDKFELDLAIGSITYTYFKNFLEFQGDFHHKHLLQLEIIKDDAFEFIHHSYKNPILTEKGDSTGIVNPDLPKHIEQFKKLSDDLPELRYNNFGMFYAKEQLYTDVVKEGLEGKIPEPNETIKRKMVASGDENTNEAFAKYKKNKTKSEKPKPQQSNEHPIITGVKGELQITPAISNVSDLTEAF